MTEPGAEFEHVLPPEQVEEFLRTVVKASRAFQMYLPNNPMFHRAAQNLQAAFAPLWSALDELVLQVHETDFVWEGTVVYHQLQKSDSMAWSLYKDGLRVLVLKKGVEQEEMPRLLRVINAVRALAPDAADDLFTLLWAEDFQFVDVRFAESAQDHATGDFATGARYAGETNQAEAVRQDLAASATTGAVAGAGEEGEGAAEGSEAAAQRPKGVVDLEEFDSTLYFLDAAEVDQLAADLQLEYSRDLREAALAALYDLFEGEGAVDGVREEIIGVLEALFPSMLNAGEFRASAAMLRESRVLAERAPEVLPAHRDRLGRFVDQLSEPAIVGQLMQALDEGTGRPSDTDVAELLRELRPAALATLVEWTPRLTSTTVRGLVEAAVRHLASANPGELLRLLRSTDGDTLRGAIDLAGRLRLEGAVAGLGEIYPKVGPPLRLAAVESLIQIGTPGTLPLLDRAVGDDDRAVRMAALKALTGRGYKGALKRVEEVVQGRGRKDLDFSERRAFFEAYGAIAGPGGVDTLRGLLERRGLFRKKVGADVRMCAALALGRIGTPEARSVLESVAEDNDRQVRNAVTAALRGAAE